MKKELKYRKKAFYDFTGAWIQKKETSLILLCLSSNEL